MNILDKFFRSPNRNKRDEYTESMTYRAAWYGFQTMLVCGAVSLLYVLFFNPAAAERGKTLLLIMFIMLPAGIIYRVLLWKWGVSTLPFPAVGDKAVLYRYRVLKEALKFIISVSTLMTIWIEGIFDVVISDTSAVIIIGAIISLSIGMYFMLAGSAPWNEKARTMFIRKYDIDWERMRARRRECIFAFIFILGLIVNWIKPPKSGLLFYSTAGIFAFVLLIVLFFEPRTEKVADAIE